MSGQGQLSELVASFRREHAPNPEIGRILEALVSPDGLPDSRAKVWGETVIDPDPETLRVLAGFVVEVIAGFLSDHALSAEEQSTIRHLKFLLRIEEGDLLRLQREAIAGVLAAEMGLILYDQEVDAAEAVHQADLQAAFDLGYDQWLELTEESIRPIVDSYVRQVSADGVITPAEKDLLLRRLAALETVVKVDLDRMEAVWGESIAEELGGVVSRSIPDALRDAVWRRDGGKCVNCGSRNLSTIVRHG